MKKSISSSSAFLLCMLITVVVHARDAVSSTKSKPSKNTMLQSGCAGPTASAELNINNVRTTLRNGGDLWWDGINAKYEIPKVTGTEPAINSMYSGSLWFGGIDAQGNVKTAAQTYRQGGVTDFYAGPLDTTNGTTSPDQCVFYDRMFLINKTDVEDFKANYQNSGYVIPPSILNWPGNGNTTFGQAKNLAPFFDKDGDGLYDATKGDYPIFDRAHPEASPDQFIWWVFNDEGDAHTAFGGEPIGLEIQTFAFAFQGGGAISNTTFYRNTVINRSTNTLFETYFGVHADPDLGNANDDYVGCDVSRGLGYCYNADNNDEVGFSGYGLNPPAIGIDFFKGPKDENGVEIKLSKFVYFNNDQSATGNPESSQDIYNYLKGIWKDGTPITYGGTGYNVGSTDSADFMFPGISDTKGRPEWSEFLEGNPLGDRRFVQSTGPFKLLPGAVNEVTFGVVWARGADYLASIEALRVADDVAQIIADNNYNLDSVPSIVKFENELIKSPEGKVVDVEITLLKEVANPVTVEVNVKGGDATVDADFAILGSKVVTFPANSTTKQIVQVEIKSDMAIDLYESIELELTNPTGGAEIAGAGVVIRIFDTPTTISSVKNIDANGQPVLMGQKVLVEGTVYSDNNLNSLIIIDNTGGIAIPQYKSRYIVGEKLLVYGLIESKDGLTILEPIDLITLGFNMNLNPPRIINKKLDESMESDLVVFEGRIVDVTKWRKNNAQFTVKFTNETDTIDVRMDVLNTINKQNPPSGRVTIAGIVSQSDFTNPRTSGYVLRPRDSADFTRLTTGIDALTLQNRISIYPNPTTDRIAINSIQAMDEIRIYNISGKKEMEILNLNTKQISITTKELPKGIYLIQTISGNSKSTSKFILR